ncbi:hypothetical protein NIES2098_05550 [Calothrix sp. NIES-2098]|nr:hypothetical protein NIES2098_05550 [Calothrix sp. NIES-2098]
MQGTQQLAGAAKIEVLYMIHIITAEARIGNINLIHNLHC